MTRASDLARLLGAGITTDDNSDSLILTSTDADASNGPNLNMFRNSSSPADNDFLGNIKFNGRNDNSQDVQYAEIEVYSTDVSDGTEDGLYNVNVMTGGTNLSYMQLKAGSGVVFNEDSNDIDFRVEGNGDANALVVEGSSDNVGIGTNSPDTKLQIKGAVNSDQFTLGGTDNRGLKISTYNQGGQNDSAVIYDAQDTEGSAANSTHIFSTGGTERMRVHGSGALTINTTSDSVGGLTAAKLVVDTDASKNSFAVGNNRQNHAAVLVEADNDTGLRYALYIVNGSGGEAGKISYTSSATTYATSSDYRLKENIKYDFDATSRLKQLKPCRFNFKIDTDNTVDGFLAHEVSSIVPEAIVGEKDAMFEEVLYVDSDEIPDGKKVGDVKTASRINPQGIDQAKIVPLLVKTIQELEARITALESA